MSDQDPMPTSGGDAEAAAGAPARATGGRVRLAAGALGTAALLTLSFPPADLWPLAFVALAPIAAVLEGRPPRAGFAAGWLAIVGLGVGGAGWLLHALVVEYGVAPAAAAVFSAAVFAAHGLVAGAALALYAGLRPALGPRTAPWLLAVLWLLAEWVRSAPLATPWLLIGHALAAAPLWVQPAEFGGALAVGLVPAALGAALGIGVRRRSWRALVAPALLLGVGAAFGAWRLAGPEPEGHVRVGVVQASVPPAERFQPGSAARNTALHLEATRALLAEGPLDLVVWSETAVDDDLAESPALAARLAAQVDTSGVPLVTGAPLRADGSLVNAVVLFAPGGGLVERYAKQRLVPFSEGDPAWGAWLAPLVPELTRGLPYVAGREPTVFRRAPLPFAAPVCFEITYPDLVREFRSAGAELLVNVSNDAWFGRTGYGEIHLRHAVFRAVELRTWVVRGANTGISAVIDPTGRVRERLPLFAQGTLAAAVGGAGEPTLYGRAGDAPVLALLLAALAATALASRGGLRGAAARAGGRRTG